MNRQQAEAKVLRAIRKVHTVIPISSANAMNNLIAAAEVLTVKELVEMIRDYGFSTD